MLCNHKQSKQTLRDLLEFLNDVDVGEIAAAGFDIILRESDEVTAIYTYNFAIHYVNYAATYHTLSIVTLNYY